MDTIYLISYYLIKRIFLFVDEWLFYYVLYKLYMNKMYYIFTGVLIYGSLCIYTSYYNIDLIEHELLVIDQKIFILDGSMFTRLLSYY